MCRWLAALVWLVAVTGACIADDGSASLAAGGIIFTKNTAIRMAAEDLYISPKQVRVRFEFANDTSKDIEIVVAFPLPDINLKSLSDVTPVGATTADPLNFVGFKTAVNGKPIAFQAEQRAFVDGKDVTAAIVASGLPINVVNGGYRIFKTISLANRKRLADAGYLYHDAVADEYIAQWTVRTKFYWTQKFPAHKTVIIEHTYQPVTGSLNPDAADASVGDFCANTTTNLYASIHGISVGYVTDYILKTANTWKGPIGRFHLTLDKLKTWNALTLCWDGSLRRTGWTTYEDTRSNFAPTRDIKMLVLE